SMLVHRADLPPELDRLVLKLMAKSPADRYQSAAEMLADLAKMRDVLQIAAAPTVTDTEMATSDGAPESSRRLAAIQASSVARSSAASTILKQTALLGQTASKGLARLSGGLIALMIAVCLVAGAIAGFLTRNPDVMSIPSDATTAAPLLWIEP